MISLRPGSETYLAGGTAGAELITYGELTNSGDIELYGMLRVNQTTATNDIGGDINIYPGGSVNVSNGTFLNDLGATIV